MGSLEPTTHASDTRRYLPFIWEQPASFCGRKLKSHISRSACEYRMPFVSQVFGRGQDYLVRKNTDVFEPFSIAHDEIGHGHRNAEEAVQ